MKTLNCNKLNCNKNLYLQGKTHYLLIINIQCSINVIKYFLSVINYQKKLYTATLQILSCTFRIVPSYR